MKITGAVPSAQQVRGASFLVRRQAALLNFATGTGKTLIALLSGFKLVSEGLVDKVLYVGTKSSVIEIKNEFGKFTDERPFVVKGFSGLQCFLQSEYSFGLMQFNTIYKVCPANESGGVVGPKDADRLGAVWGDCRVALFLDEVHSIKNPLSAVTKGWWALRGYFARLYGLTATPMTRDIYDLYHVVRFFAPDLLGSIPSFNARFINRVLVPVKVKGRVRKIWRVSSYRNLDTLSQLLSSVKLDYFPSFDVHFFKHEATLSRITEYTTAAHGFLRAAERKGPSGMPSQHSVRMIDLQMVVNADPNKQAVFAERVRARCGQGVLVYCSFYRSIDVVSKVLKELGVSFRMITGKQEAARRRQCKEWFVSDPSGKVLIVTVAGGQSLNLQATPNVIFWDLPFGVGHFIQIMGRIVREFSAYKEFFVDFVVVKDTLDEYKFLFLQSKKELIEKLTSNEVLPAGELNGYNAYVLRALRDRFCWRSPLRAKSFVGEREGGSENGMAESSVGLSSASLQRGGEADKINTEIEAGTDTDTELAAVG